MDTPTPTAAGPGLRADRSSSLSGDEEVIEVVAAGGGSSRSVGELDADTCSVGEGVAAAMDAKVLEELVHAGTVGRADAAQTTAVYDSPVLDKPAVETGLTGSLDTAAGGRLVAVATLLG